MLAFLLHAPDGFLVKRIGARLEIDQEGKLLLLGFPGARLNAVAAGNVHRHGLGQVHMDARFNRRGGLLVMKIGRALDRHRVHLRLQHSLKTLQAREAPRRGHVVLVAKGVHAVGEIIVRRR